MIIFFLINFFKKNAKKIPLTTYSLLLTIIFFTGFFDHYWLTLKQNFLILAFVWSETLKRS